MVRRVIGARFGVLPDGVPAPIHLFESGKTIYITAESIEDIAVGEQVRIDSDRPGWVMRAPSMSIRQVLPRTPNKV